MTINQNNKDNQQNNHDNNNYNNYTLPGVSEEMLIKIGRAYVENVAPRLTRAAADIIEDGLKIFDPDTVLLAIEETGLAPRPSPVYLRAILRNWKEKGVTARVRGSWWQNPALQYQKRESTDFSFKPLEELLNI